MIWNSKSIENISNRINEGESIKSALRDISIDCIINNEENPNFPFYINPSSNYVDTGLRGSNIEYEYTKEEIVNIIKYKDSPDEFLRSQIGPANLSELERLVTLEYKNNRFSNIVYNFSHSTSNDAVLYNILIFISLHYSIFNNDSKIGIFSNTINHVGTNRDSNLLDIYSFFPFYIKPGIRSVNKKKDHTKISFDNGSSICLSSKLQLLSFFDFVILYTNNPDLNFIKDTVLSLGFKKNSRFIIISEKKIENQSIFHNLDIKYIERDKKISKIISL